jgi:hypothetical protein
MFRYFKGEPSEFVIHTAGGKVRREGPGLSFFYFTWPASIAIVPTTTVDVSFIFNEVTKNFQGITIQGQLTYKVHEPRKAAALLDYTVTPKTRAYRTKDPEKLGQRIINLTQGATQRVVRTLDLDQALRAEALATVMDDLARDPELQALGVVVLSLHFLAVKPTPETGKALEAEFRESLLRKADESIYARRAAAVEQERKIKENELATATALEQQRQKLLALQATNAEEEARYKAKAMEIELAPFVKVEPRLLMALAFRQLGANAQKIGNLTITPDLLTTMLGGGPSA